MSEPALLTQKDGHVLTVTINRPEKKNAVNAEVLCGLSDTWRTLDDDGDLRACILTGTGKDFCAGMDLSVINKLTAGTPPENEFEERLKTEPNIIFDGWLKTYRPTKPVIAAVEGFALAGGTEILQGTDIRVAGESAVFGVTEARRALFPMAGSTVRLPRQIPYTIALEMLLTGADYTARQCLEFGLIGHVVPDGQALAKAREIAEVIAGNGPIAVRAILKSVRDSFGLPSNKHSTRRKCRAGFPSSRRPTPKKGQPPFSRSANRSSATSSCAEPSLARCACRR